MPIYVDNLPGDDCGSSAILDSELFSECPGLLTILLHLLADKCLSQPASDFCFLLLGKSWKVSLRNVVISCSTKQPNILRAYGQSVPFGFTMPRKKDEEKK